MRTNLFTRPARTIRSRPGRALAGAALAVSLTLTVAACGSDDSSSDSSSSVDAAADHNEADVQFAREMLQHHAQAIEMVDMTEGRDLSPEVQDLAEQIKAAQEPEINTFTKWLTAWNQEVPATSGDHDMGSMDMPGMMSDEDMTALEDASDADFEDMWLSMMIEHHEGAVDMAETEVADGEYQPAVDLAKTIATSQTSEIDTMQNLLS